MNRRGFLVSGLALAAGCDGVRAEAARWLEPPLPPLTAPAGDRRTPERLLLDRATFGPRPGDEARLRVQGIAAWLDAQLDPASIDDGACRVLARRFEGVEASAGEAYEYEDEVLATELARTAVIRAVSSQRQLLEVMVAFWTDHFNISVAKAAVLKAADDREVIRAHALGRFRDLLRASALSPAMLVYLDGRDNVRRSADDVPNENYARELLELHTLGVHGGYDQRDVAEAARCLTGFTVHEGAAWSAGRPWRRRGSVYFDPRAHDDGDKVVLGTVIPAGGGEDDLERLLDIVVAHPATARHLAHKLCRWFIGEDPDDASVAGVAAAFSDSDGDIATTLRAVFDQPAFWSAPPARIKRPFRFVVSALRAVGAHTHAGPEVLEFLARMGQTPFQHPTPDGYPLEAGPWLGGLLWRWRFARALCDGALGRTDVRWDALQRALGDPSPPELFAFLVGRRPEAREAGALAAVPRSMRQVAAVALASPAFQVH